MALYCDTLFVRHLDPGNGFHFRTRAGTRQLVGLEDGKTESTIIFGDVRHLLFRVPSMLCSCDLGQGALTVLYGVDCGSTLGELPPFPWSTLLVDN
jgi:hypothetical protein